MTAPLTRARRAARRRCYDSMHRCVEGGHQFDEGFGVQGLLDGFFAAEQFAGIDQQVVLRFIVSGENKNDQPGEFSVARIEVDPLRYSANYYQGLEQSIDARVRNGEAIFPAAGGYPLAFLHQAQESFGRIADGVGRGDAHFLQDLLFGSRLERGEEELGVDGVFQGDRTAPANQEFDGGRGNQRGEQGHDDQGHEHSFANQAKLQGEKAENHFQGAARVHGQADAPGGATVHAAQAGAHSCAGKFADAGYADDGGGNGQIEIGDEIGAQADAGEKEGSEDVGDDAVDEFGRAFAQVRGFADGDADDEGAEDGVNTGVFCEGGRAESEREDEAENAAGPAGVRLDVRQELVDQPAEYGEGEHHEGDDQQDGAFHAVHGCAGAVHHAQDHREQDPADEVVEHGG